MQPLDQHGLPVGYPHNPDWEITPREYVRRRDAGERMVLIDCRTPAERDLASIAGAVHVPMHDLGSRIESLREHESTPIIVHCHHGMRSLRVARWLREQGFAGAQSMAGGIDAWSESIDPTIPRY